MLTKTINLARILFGLPVPSAPGLAANSGTIASNPLSPKLSNKPNGKNKS